MACEHFPRTAKKNCPICFPKSIYSLSRTIMLDNNPVIEILRDNDVWSSPWDTNFRFGTKKALMIISCMEEIEKFALSRSPAAEFNPPKNKTSYLIDLGGNIYIQTYPEFPGINGKIVKMPYMRLDLDVITSSSAPPHLGFGQLKAAALVILQDDLRNWLVNQGKLPN